ncbi:MAG: DUF305 domain-containing protein [Gemmatimonadetes bacterium]|nr:MAG: DUF305 domain-containing protein [Gemmatimonadota bacterium]
MNRIARHIAASALPLGLVIGAASAQAPADSAHSRYTAADVAFMQGMIAHHAQAVEMAALVAARSARPDMQLLAQRIDVSQRDEIATMQRWLRSRHQEVPVFDGGHEHHDSTGHSMLMPGMLTPEEMAELARATGPGFERLFLQGMIKHHEGALKMVAGLLASRGAAQEPQIFGFASDVDADQRAEIARMRAMLDAYPTVKREPQ